MRSDEIDLTGGATPSHDAAAGGQGPEARINEAVMQIAQIIGRRIARDCFDAGGFDSDSSEEDNTGDK